ncbi:hypothetical protein CFBP3846_03839 [Pseudomonas syringae pv. avii]|uniref:Uncharacterized protein n=1 Tax=Pseudomonas syringae pv. avii TaxID=663959 RepID=A0ABY1U9V5_PSESX|nr:hypothetical protein CFBP3846_03839 [Pseudomonas syringae pv. avii]
MNLDKALVLRTCANNMADHCGLILYGPLLARWNPNTGSQPGGMRMVWSVYCGALEPALF